MSAAEPSDHAVTRTLRRWQAGDSAAFEQLVPLVYPELRKQAAGRLRSERANHTLQPTALIHEAFLRLMGSDCRPTDRIHFFALASTVMRQVLVDYARSQSRAKRGGDWQRCTLNEALDRCGESPELVVDLDHALSDLAEEQSRSARALELHYFGGMDYEEIAAALGTSKRTVSRELRFGKAWLRSQLGAAG